MKTSIALLIFIGLMAILLITPAIGGSAAFKDNIYNPGQLKPIDSKLKVKIGDPAPDFTLPSVTGEKITLFFLIFLCVLCALRERLNGPS